MKKPYRFLCGPVRSRRLGRSLGVDLVPFKTCPYDCIYCELGKTTHKTAVPGDFLPPEEILEELREKLKENHPIDYITLAGAGEPTLNSRIGEVIRGIKEATDVPVALLTSGALFWMERVRESVREADLIVPSLDAGDDMTFQMINRPHPDVTFEKMLHGLCELRRSYSGPIWLEIFLVGGISTSDEEILKIRNCARRMSPDRIQLNTVDRATAEPFVQAVSKEEMERIASFFGPRCEIIGTPDRKEALRSDFI